jgi:hypothetical protein
LPYRADDGIQFNYLMSLIRAVLQYCSYSLVEYWQKYSPETEETDCEIVKQLLSPSDGSFVSVIDKILPNIKNNLWPNCADSWFKKRVHYVNDEEITIEPLVNRVNEWVIFRNNRLGNGVVDKETITEKMEWLFELARDIVIGLGDLIPCKMHDKEKLILKIPNYELDIETIK